MGRKQIIKRNYDNEGKLISKECSCCHEVKPVSEFNKSKSSKDRLQFKCKECLRKYRKNNAESIKEYHKEYYRDNTENIKERSKEYYKNNAENIKEYKKQYYKDNTENIKEYQKQYQKQYRKDNAESIKECKKEYRKNNAESLKEYNKEYNTKKIQEALQQIKTEVENNPDKYNYIEGKDIYGIIYLVHNINSDKYYVGQTITGFDNRYPLGWLYEHSKKDTVKKDLQLYGKESFKFIKLFKVAHSQYELDKLEAYYIDRYDSYKNGYNETRGNIFTNRGKEEII